MRNRLRPEEYRGYSINFDKMWNGAVIARTVEFGNVAIGENKPAAFERAKDVIQKAAGIRDNGKNKELEAD